MCSCSLVCTLYAVCMHPQLHTFSASQPYGHAYSRFCMHCMQSIPELCLRIACIVGFLMHTMHTTFDRPSERRNGRIAYMPAETHDDREARMGRDGGGRRGRVRGKPWGTEPGRGDLRAGRIGAGTHMADTRSPGKRLNPGDKRKLTRTRHPSGVGEYSSILESGRSGKILGDLS